MKIILLGSNSFSQRNRPLTAALLLTCLGVTAVSAQSPAGSSTGTTDRRPTTTDRATTSTPSGTPRDTTGVSSANTTGAKADTQSATDPTRAANTKGMLKRADRKFITKAAESSQKEAAMAQLAAQRATRPEVRSFAQELVSNHQQMNSELMQLAQRKGVSLDSMGMDRSAAMRSSSGQTGPSTNAGVATAHGAPRATGAAGTANTGASTGVTPNASTATSGSAMAGSDAASTAGLPAELASDREFRKLARASGAEFDEEYVDMMVDQHERVVQLFQKTAKNSEDGDVRQFASTHLPKLQAHLDRANNLMKSAAE